MNQKVARLMLRNLGYAVDIVVNGFEAVAPIKRFPRTEESGWALETGEIRRALSSKTKLIVVTNLHNPTSVLTPDAALREIADLAASVGATLSVDEVYLDAVYENTPRTSFHLAGNIVVTSSLTKVYGVSSGDLYCRGTVQLRIFSGSGRSTVVRWAS